MKLLHKLLPKQENKDTKAIIQNFLLKLQPEYPKKIYVSYDRGGEPIPMPMDSGEPIPLEMFKGDPIVLMSNEQYLESHQQNSNERQGAQVEEEKNQEEEQKQE